jgi:hypothetical protein
MLAPTHLVFVKPRVLPFFTPDFTTLPGTRLFGNHFQTFTGPVVGFLKMIRVVVSITYPTMRYLGS